MPASRADLFADRALSLADKRSLGRFMAACVEAAEAAQTAKVRQAVGKQVYRVTCSFPANSQPLLGTWEWPSTA